MKASPSMYYILSTMRVKELGGCLLKVYIGECGIIRSSLIFYHKSTNDSIYSLSANFLGSRTIMAQLTLAPEGSGSLAKLQQLHELLRLRSGWTQGCRMSENKKRSIIYDNTL